MKGHVARKRDRYYAVIYEGIDPIDGKEKRTWIPAGTDRAEAEALAARLAAERDGRNDEIRSLSFGAYLTGRWLPAKKLELATSTYRSHVHKTQRHILPTLGRKRLRPEDPERLCDSMLHPTDGTRPLSPKTVDEVHLIIRGALEHAVRRRLVNRNVALDASAPKPRAIPKVEQKAWTADQLAAFLRAAAGHRLFPALWLAANTGMRRSELLGLKWSDLDVAKKHLSINRGLVAVGYELHESRGKTDNSRRCIDLDDTSKLPSTQRSASTTPTGCSPPPTADPSTRTPSARPSTGSCAARPSPSSDCTTCATPTAPSSSPTACTPRSCPNASATPGSRSPSRPTSTCSPAWAPTPPASSSNSSPTPHPKTPRSRKPVEHPGERSRNPVEHPTNDESPGR